MKRLELGEDEVKTDMVRRFPFAINHKGQQWRGIPPIETPVMWMLESKDPPVFETLKTLSFVSVLVCSPGVSYYAWKCIDDDKIYI